MLKNRIIPVLLLKDKNLVKTIQFDKKIYIGDPINTIRIFNEKEVDELIILDIGATKENRSPDFSFIRELASECFMPLTYGGGISSIEDIKKLFRIGVEKVVINSAFLKNPELIKSISEKFGSQSLVISIDVKSSKKNKVFSYKNSKVLDISPLELSKKAQALGAGEIMINSIDRDGSFLGYDLDLINLISKELEVPLIICGGANSLENLKQAIDSGASAAAAGSFFVFYGKNRAVLITYPDRKELESLLQ